MGFELNFDLKQHINLSTECWNCLYSDIRSFSTTSRPLKMNGLLNLIIANYWQDADASISLRLQDMRDRLEKTLPAKSDAIKQLLAVEEKRLIERNSYSHKGTGKQFLINKEQKDILEDSLDEKYYDGKAGKYLHALFEEYAKLPYYKRERIVFDKTVKEIESAIRNKYILKVKTDKLNFEVRPYKLIKDTDNTYNYLVGYSVIPSDSASKPAIASFRLSRISHITKMFNSRAELSYMEEEEIDNAIKERGVAYLVGKPACIKVKLSPVGVNLYSVILQGRPSFVKTAASPDDNGWTEYEFYCTERQAMNYFTRLGKHAVIIEPITLKEDMINSFKDALRNYEEFGNF